MTFDSEAKFEAALIEALQNKGWGEGPVLRYPSEKDLLRNWAEILFQNNRHIDRLNDVPLTDGEMQQILEEIKHLRSPVLINRFINGKSVTITRDNPADMLHYQKQVSLKIYDRFEIAAGQSRYQIAQQPIFNRRSPVLNDRRGDLMLLINGMPVIHIELKKSGVSVTQAENQIVKYAHEGLFSGIYSLIQIFVAMEPNETTYFANPGPDGSFNRDFYFHWADVNNVPVNDWKQITNDLLSIPMAHQMIGFYTIPDSTDGVLKVMRSYQYYAASKISDRVTQMHWDGRDRLGGYIWHTTGSGKTMTSFKAAQLIADSDDADKVVFLIDRIELGTQSLDNYRNFAGAGLTAQQKMNTVQATEDSQVLVSKLKDDDPANKLIVTSIQKMSIIAAEEQGRYQNDIRKINGKRIVIIVDECHRSTFGEMMTIVKATFPKAVFFGFSGTPIFMENAKKHNDTSDVFGNELHRYTIAHGIQDKNVLGFDPYMVVFAEKELRKAVALEKAKAKTLEEALADPIKAQTFYYWMDPQKVPMAGQYDAAGNYALGIEDYVPNSQYREQNYVDSVIKDIASQFPILSHGGKFHALFATSSIPEAIVYYRRMKELAPNLKIAALFDPSIDNTGEEQLSKEDGLVEIISDYNARYDLHFSLSNFASMKKDIAKRLAHKDEYRMIAKTPEKQIDLLIVVDQMLTGYDSKWINTLYLDKLIRNEMIIQAFSRTNRLFGPEKPFGIIRYYRKPYTMARRIEEAVKLYSGDRPLGLFALKLPANLEKMNDLYGQICVLFDHAGIANFERLPGEKEVIGKFVSLFHNLSQYMEAASVQGFTWKKSEYRFQDPERVIQMAFDQHIYNVLLKRYKEAVSGGSEGSEDVPYEIDGHLVEMDTGRIDAEYMDSRFKKYLINLEQEHVNPEELQQTLDDLHKSFASLTQEEQKYANIFLHDVQTGAVQVLRENTFRDYINQYLQNARNDQIHRLADSLGIDESKLRAIMSSHVTEQDIDAFGRLTDLENTVDINKAKAYFESKEGKKISQFDVFSEVDELLRSFILKDGFEL